EIQETEPEIPLLREYDTENEQSTASHTSEASSASKLAEKARSAMNTLKGKMVLGAITDVPPFSRWSPERSTFDKLGSGADSLPRATPSISISSTASQPLTSSIRNRLRKQPPK